MAKYWVQPEMRDGRCVGYGVYRMSDVGSECYEAFTGESDLPNLQRLAQEYCDERNVPEYTFDCVFWGSVWVRAATEEEARTKMRESLASVRVDVDDGDVKLQSISIEDDGGASELLLIDGELPEDVLPKEE